MMSMIKVISLNWLVANSNEFDMEPLILTYDQMPHIKL